MTIEKVSIGDATLYHGDCMDVLPTLGKVDAVVTDPPYGMGFSSGYRLAKYDPILNDNSTNLIRYICKYPVSHSKYVFCRWDNLYDLPKPQSCITWIKNNWSMGDLSHEHARQTELILFWPGDNHCFKKRPTDVIDARRTGNGEHPTEKPVYLMEHICMWTDGVIVDPFMGSGTTGVACMNLGRKFIGIELERKYFDIACERIEQARAQPDMFIQTSRDTYQQVALDENVFKPSRPGDAYDKVTIDYER